MSSWGILGNNPSQDQIAQWQNMPYGEFKKMVAAINKKAKGKTPKQFEVRVKRFENFSQSSYHTVEAFDATQAIEKVKEFDKTTFEWHEKVKEADKYSYEVIRVE